MSDLNASHVSGDHVDWVRFEALNTPMVAPVIEFLVRTQGAGARRTKDTYYQVTPAALRDAMLGAGRIRDLELHDQPDREVVLV